MERAVHIVLVALLIIHIPSRARAHTHTHTHTLTHTDTQYPSTTPVARLPVCGEAKSWFSCRYGKRPKSWSSASLVELVTTISPARAQQARMYTQLQVQDVHIATNTGYTIASGSRCTHNHRHRVYGQSHAQDVHIATGR